MGVRQLAKRVGHLIIRLSECGKATRALDLTGDRGVEWSWVAAHLPDKPGEVLDFGSGDAPLGLIAAIRGGAVTALDLQQIHLPYAMRRLGAEKGDILDFDFAGKQFDLIINCSSIEHVGLAGRYGSRDEPDGDLIAMERLRRVLRMPGGIMLLTIPVGNDLVVRPWHRVYGIHRLGLLLKGFRVVDKEFWSKRPGSNSWIQVSEAEAFSVRASESFYALGMFVLEADN